MRSREAEQKETAAALRLASMVTGSLRLYLVSGALVWESFAYRPAGNFLRAAHPAPANQFRGNELSRNSDY